MKEAFSSGRCSQDKFCQEMEQLVEVRLSFLPFVSHEYKLTRQSSRDIVIAIISNS